MKKVKKDKDIKYTRIVKKGKVIISLILIIIFTMSPFLNITYAEEKPVEDKTENNTEKSIDVASCVEIAGSQDEGYYIKFVDNIDQKLQTIYDSKKSMYQNLGVENISTLKKMLKAQIATEFPSMGGVVESSNPISNGTEAPAGGNTGGGSSGGGTGGNISISSGDITWPQEALDLSLLGDEDFGKRVLSYGSTPHDGLDMNNVPEMAPCLAFADGEVVNSGHNGAYGYSVKIWHEKLQVYSFYGHMSPELPLSVGQKVTKGTVVGYQSGTGINGYAEDYPSHLHFGIHAATDDRESLFSKEQGLDPLEFFEKAGIIKVVSKPEESLYASDVYVLEAGNNAQNSTINIGSGGKGSSSTSGGTSDNQGATITIKDNNNINGDENKFQGGVKLRRLTPNKAIGEYKNDLTGDAIYNTGETFENMGKASEIPVMIKEQIKKASLTNGAAVNIDNLVYLTIPYIDFNENIKEGHMIVNKSVAQDVINIFYELYSNKYPIARMEIVDNFLKTFQKPALDNNPLDKDNPLDNNENNLTKNNTNDNTTKNSTTDNTTKDNTTDDNKTITVDNRNELGKASADNNNTSSLYYNIWDASSHMTGNGVDINPMINPKVKGGTTEQYNAEQYVDRSKKDSWDEDAKKAYIDKESQVYKIFEKYGWSWGGDSGDYGHFEKTTTTKSDKKEESIDSRYHDLSYVSEQVFNSYVSKGDKRALYVYTLNANKEVVLASWSYTTDSGFKVSKGQTVNYKSALSKYSMPFEYLSVMLIQSSDVGFVEELASLAANSEYIITVQDKVNTIETKITKVKKDEFFTRDWVYDTTGETTIEGPEVKINETASQTPGVTYVNNWYIKYAKNFSGSTNSIINSTTGLIKEQNVKVNGTKTSGYNSNDDVKTNYGTLDDKSHFVETVTTTTAIGNVAYEYNTGQDTVSGNAEKFVNLYKGSNIAVKNNIYIPWLEDALESDSKTSNLVDITKYVFYQANERNFKSTTLIFEEYKPDDFKSASGSSSNGNLNITGGSVEEKVWNALKSAGYSDTAVAAAMGNIYEESGFNPSVVEGGSGVGFGLCQWSWGRRTQLEGFTASRGKEPSDVDIQIEFLLAELTPEGGADGFATYQFGGHEEDRNTWMTSTDIGDATMAFCLGFERPRDPSQSEQKRVAAAQSYYNQYHK